MPAADPQQAAASPQSAALELAAKRAKLAEQISKLAQDEEQTETAEKPEKATQAEEELELLRTLDLIYMQHQATIEQRINTEQQKQATQAELSALQAFGLPEAKPYSFLLLEDVRDQLAAEEARQKVTESDIAGAQQLLEAARESFDESEQERRLAQETLENNDEPDMEAELAHELRLAELNSAIEQATVVMRRAEIEAKTMRKESCELRQVLLEEKAEQISKDVKFTELDFNSRWNSLKQYSRDLKKKLKEAETRLQELPLHKARTEAAFAEQKADKALKAAANEAFQVAGRVLHQEITLINQRLRELEQFRYFWEGRYEVINGKGEKEDLEEWRESLNSFLERIEQSQTSLALRLDEIRLDQATLFGRLREANSQDAERQKWVEYQDGHLQRLAELCEISLLSLKTSQRSADRFLEDLEERIEPEGTYDWFGPIRESFLEFWNYELASVDDQPITVRKIVSGLAYVLIGILVARFISRFLGKRVLPRFGLNDGASHAVQSISFYSLCLLFALLSLEIVNLPFAAFTFLGGAAAIGIGFGSQSILNNFISGLILLAEQPIRVGDLVEIDGLQGTVEHIGARSTRVRTVSNHEIVFPNSKLLENKVTNLTLTDNLVQTAIGISLNSSLSFEQARESLVRAASSHPQVLASPAPVVLFKEFSPTSMKFELHFWLRLRGVMECQIVESEVREQINQIFADASAATTPLSKTTSEIAGKIGSAAPAASPAAKPQSAPLRKAG